MAVTNPHDAEEQIRPYLSELYEARLESEATAEGFTMRENIALDRAFGKCMVMLGLERLL